MKKLAIAAVIATIFSANAFAVEVTDSDVGRWNEAANNVQNVVNDMQDVKNELFDHKAQTNAGLQDLANKTQEAVLGVQQKADQLADSIHRIDLNTQAIESVAQQQYEMLQKQQEEAKGKITKAVNDVAMESAARQRADEQQQKQVADLQDRLATEAQYNNVQQGYIDYALDTNNRQQETIDHHSKEIANNREAIKSLNKNFADLKDKVDDNRKKAAAGIAGVAAMAGMPQVEQGKRFMLSAGVGGYDGEQAVAVGFSTRLTHNVVAKAGVSATTQSEVVWSAGAGVSW